MFVSWQQRFQVNQQPFVVCSSVWEQFTVKNHPELHKVSCFCSKYLLLLFPPELFVCECVQELNATTRYSQRRRDQAEDTQVHKHTTHTEISCSSSLVFHKLLSVRMFLLFLIRAPEEMTNQKLQKFPTMKQTSDRYFTWSSHL